MIRILLVEDEPVIAYLHERILKRRGCQVIAVVKAQTDILHYLPRTDLVLMDIALQERTDGIDFCRQIKNAYPQLKVVFLSAYPRASFEKELASTDYDGYIDKMAFEESIDGILSSSL